MDVTMPKWLFDLLIVARNMLTGVLIIGGIIALVVGFLFVAVKFFIAMLFVLLALALLAFCYPIGESFWDTIEFDRNYD